MTDHYDPRDKSLSLSDSVYESSSIAAIGVAAHENRTCDQDSVNYSFEDPECYRTGCRDWLDACVSPFLHRNSSSGQMMMDLGIVLFLGVILFHLVTLPAVEFDASNRALRVLADTGMLSTDEIGGAGAVLRAASWTYVAATVTFAQHSASLSPWYVWKQRLKTRSASPRGDGLGNGAAFPVLHFISLGRKGPESHAFAFS